MLVVKQKFIFREDLKNNPDVLYIFGDNTERVGYGGQAKEMRGEPNAFGIVTKNLPDYGYRECYLDETEELHWDIVRQDFRNLKLELSKYKAVVIPSDGIGTGLAELKHYAPLIFKYICDNLNELRSL